MTSTQFKKKLEASHVVYNEWETQFQPRTLYEYYEGKQWKGMPSRPFRSAPYVLNLINAAIETKIANLMFTTPKFIVDPQPGASNWDSSSAFATATLKESFLNAVTLNPKMDFVGELEQYLTDSFFSFGVMAIDYQYNFLNPLHDEPEIDDDGKEKQSYDVPASEALYCQRIEPWRFRTSADRKSTLEKTEWYGYYDFVSRKTLEAADGIDFPLNYVPSYFTPGFSDIPFAADSKSSTDSTPADLVRVWHIWSNSTKMRYLFLDGEMHELWKEPFNTTSGLVTLRWKRRDQGWLPIPPVYNWIFPQDEINESRQAMRDYRRRYKRGYGYHPDIDPTELENMTSGAGDFFIKMPNPNMLWPIENPSLGLAINEALVISKDDFNISSASTSDLRGPSERETATAAKISAVRSGVRESFVQRTFGANVGLIGRTILLIAQEKMQVGYWVKLTQDLGDTLLEEYQSNVAYKFISPDTIRDGYDASVSIDVVNNTPAAQEEQKVAFLEFVTLVSSNPILSSSPVLIQEAAYRVGYKNDRVIRDFQRMSMLQQAAQAAQAGNAQAGNAGAGDNNNMQKGMAERNDANSQAQIESQLEGQLQ